MSGTLERRAVELAYTDYRGICMQLQTAISVVERKCHPWRLRDTISQRTTVRYVKPSYQEGWRKRVPTRRRRTLRACGSVWQP